MLALLLTFLSLASTVFSSHLTVMQPVREQLPLIARVDTPYSWSPSTRTFSSTNGPVTYSTSPLPAWLSFDPGTLFFHGTPSAKDEGYPKITITGTDSSGTASSTFTLCVTSSPEPTVQLPISQQFAAPAPSLSSVFILSSNSGIPTHSPGLRIPPSWSFSIGFEHGTVISPTRLIYTARMRDGSVLPSWMEFDPSAITLNGVTPAEHTISQPEIIALSLYASDLEGFSTCSLPFEVVVASHELSMTAVSLPTINITAATPFDIALNSSADFSGVQIDGIQIQSSEIMTLVVDTSQCGTWLRYDSRSRTLSGDPRNITFAPEQTLPLVLPVTITTSFNQTIQTRGFINIVTSYFSSDALPPIQGVPGESIDFDLRPFFSEAATQDNVTLTVAFEPPRVARELQFDSHTGRLLGAIPSDLDVPRIIVTFTAYSRVTHSTSHTDLSIVCSPPENTRKGFHPLGLSATAHTRLVLGLGIAFGVVGGLCFIGGLLAVFRRFARVEDTAIGGEEGRNVWSEQDRKWYGKGLGEARGYGRSGGNPNFTGKLQSPMNYQAPYKVRSGIYDQYGNLGLGLRRVSERSQSQSSPRGIQSPGVMSKREFFTRLRETVRAVSDRAQGRKASRQRPVIGRPILSASQLPPIRSEPPTLVSSPSNPFDESALPSHPGSTIMTSSPSTSTAEHSIPRRRADFAPPRQPTQVHFEHSRLSRQPSSSSSTSGTSRGLHATEAVVQAASKAISIHSGRSASERSFTTEVPAVSARPRLVPFTGVSRVPPPGLENGEPRRKRVVSQTATVWRRDPKDKMTKGGSSDELQMGLHYVQSLGAEANTTIS